MSNCEENYRRLYIAQGESIDFRRTYKIMRPELSPHYYSPAYSPDIFAVVNGIPDDFRSSCVRPVKKEAKEEVIQEKRKNATCSTTTTMERGLITARQALLFPRVESCDASTRSAHAPTDDETMSSPGQQPTFYISSSWSVEAERLSASLQLSRAKVETTSGL